MKLNLSGELGSVWTSLDSSSSELDQSNAIQFLDEISLLLAKRVAEATGVKINFEREPSLWIDHIEWQDVVGPFSFYKRQSSPLETILRENPLAKIVDLLAYFYRSPCHGREVQLYYFKQEQGSNLFRIYRPKL